MLNIIIDARIVINPYKKGEEKNGTTRQVQKALVPTIQAELKKGHYACGYFSFEYNNKVARKKDYKAIFNIYKKASIDNLQKTNNINTKTKFKKSSDIHFKNGIIHTGLLLWFYHKYLLFL